MCSYYNSCFFTKDCNRKNCGSRLHDDDLEQSHEKKKDLHMLFFPFLSSRIPDLALGILKILIHV